MPDPTISTIASSINPNSLRLFQFLQLVHNQFLQLFSLSTHQSTLIHMQSIPTLWMLDAQAHHNCVFVVEWED